MKPQSGLKFLLPHLSDQDVKVIERYVSEQRIDELKSASVGRVTNERNKNQKTYMSGFGYAANNLQDHKSSRLATLKQEAEGL